MSAPLPAPATLVDEELNRLIDSDALRRAPSHTRLLRYLVERRIAGDAAAFRETSIALEVFRRDPATYDPQTDPIVRVTIRRLRERLETHYARYNQPPKLRIVLPKGRYEPEFVIVAAAPGPQGVAIMRARNATGDVRHDALCGGFADRLTDGLARLGVPRVIARESVAQAEATNATSVDVGRRLDVEWVVESHVAIEPDGQLRATARLLNATDASVHWVETHTDGEMNRFVTLDAIADRVFARFAARLQGNEATAESGDLAGLSPDERDALDVATMLVRERAHPKLDSALAVVEGVAAAHPGCAKAWGVLAAARFLQGSMMDREFMATYAAARADAQRALAIDPDLPEPALVLAAISGIHDLDWKPAMAQLRGLLRRYPHLTVARSNLATLLQYVGAFTEALDEIALARAHDPLSMLPRLNDANIRAYARRHDEARRGLQVLRKVGVEPHRICVFSGNNELWDGALDAAEAMYTEASTLLPDNPTPWMCLGFVRGRRGDAKGTSAIEADCVARFPQTSWYQRAMLSGAMRDKPQVLSRLNDARRRHDPLLMSACVDPSFDWLGGDPDFNRLLQDWGLPGWRGAARDAPAG
ncbi:MAG: hypothetical protein ABI724_18110 [Betaproteobacteria bacterium]